MHAPQHGACRPRHFRLFQALVGVAADMAEQAPDLPVFPVINHSAAVRQQPGSQQSGLLQVAGNNIDIQVYFRGKPPVYLLQYVIQSIFACNEVSPVDQPGIDRLNMYGVDGIRRKHVPDPLGHKCDHDRKESHTG